MLEDKKELLEKNTFIHLRRSKKAASAFEKMRNRYFLLGILLSIILIGAIYYLSPWSRIYRITVKGNIYLRDEDIIALSGLDEESHYYLSIPALIEKKILKEELIEECQVKLLNDRHVEINVKEKKIIAYMPENGLSVLILEDDQRIPISRDNMYLIGMVPIIEGFPDDELLLVEKNLARCDQQIINEISEIHYYPEMRYQDVELVMADGNYIFTSAYGLPLLEHYYDIKASYLSEESCYYFEDISGNAYISSCPWEETEEEVIEEEIEEEEE